MKAIKTFRNSNKILLLNIKNNSILILMTVNIINN